MTHAALTVLAGGSKLGNTATATRPGGTRARTSRRRSSAGSVAETEEGREPPPGVPGWGTSEGAWKEGEQGMIPCSFILYDSRQV